jgi:hypothetical protein
VEDSCESAPSIAVRDWNEFMEIDSNKGSIEIQIYPNPVRNHD